ANPGAPSAADAIPAKQPPAVTDFSEGPAQNDKQMADAEVTEDQLAKGNEPDFNEALSAKKTAETDSAKAPAKGQAAESQQLTTAKAGAAASGAAAMTALTATRTQAGQKVDGGKGETKSKDEKKRAEVTARLQKVYDGTKKEVETTLSDLDKKVDTAFTAGEKSARDAFTADHKRRMKKYKDKRYSGWTGKARWVKDKFAGLPEAANDLYQEARKLYVAQMQTVISSVADLIGTELGRAKARIAEGRTELKAEVDKLPADLRQFGEEAAKDFAGKFDDLEATVNEKSEQLVQDLASKYTAALNKIDEEIKKLQEANKGLIDKAKDAIVGVIKTINELKNLLLGILAKAAGAIMKIIKDPIGFLGNLVRAVGAGLNLFITNIAEHLKTGVVSWLLGTAVKAGLELPQKFDMKGIIQLIGSLLGLTWDNIKARVTRKGVPDEAMAAVETSVPVAKSIASEGPAGAVKEIQAEAGDLKATILEKLTSYLIPTVIIAGITWILSLLNPASAFIRAVKGIIDIVTFVVTQGAQIAEFVNSVLDAVVAIANGGQAGVPKMVEAALAASVPLLIGFLVSLLGIGSLANKVKQVFHAVARPVNRAIDKIVDFIAKRGKSLWGKSKKKDDTNGKPSGHTKETSGKEAKKRRELPAATSRARQIVKESEEKGASKKALLAALNRIRHTYTWIQDFRALGTNPPFSVLIIASEHRVSDYDNRLPQQLLSQIEYAYTQAKESVDSLTETRKDGRVQIALSRNESLREEEGAEFKKLRYLVNKNGTFGRKYQKTMRHELTDRNEAVELARSYLDGGRSARELEGRLKALKEETPPKLDDKVEIRTGHLWVASQVTEVNEKKFHYTALEEYGRSDSGQMPIQSQNWRDFDPGRHYKKGNAWEKIKNADEWNNYPDARQTLNYRHHKIFKNPTGMEWHHIHEQSLNGPNSVSNLTLSTEKQNATFNHWFGAKISQGVSRRDHLRRIGASADQCREWGDECLRRNGLKVQTVDKGRGPYQILVEI
ncbi:phage tail protein, partial [Streptomyces poriferorum]|uniref:phage tail protein n=2 Tax=Streptomyces poriferorum TaxID=2798799 RepID=UPI001F3D5744